VERVHPALFRKRPSDFILVREEPTSPPSVVSFLPDSVPPYTGEITSALYRGWRLRCAERRIRGRLCLSRVPRQRAAPYEDQGHETRNEDQGHETRNRPDCGNYEVRFPDGRPSKYFYFENLPGRRLGPDRVEQAVAEQNAKRFAREEQDKLDSKYRY